jgi:hypothetical protein
MATTAPDPKQKSGRAAGSPTRRARRAGNSKGSIDGWLRTWALTRRLSGSRCSGSRSHLLDGSSTPKSRPILPLPEPTRWAMCGRLRVVKGSITSQRWSEQPCVRPISAAHRAAGHNALRGSDPGQKLAFNDALAHVGCPDHRVDRFCITCCPPFPTVTSHRCRRDLVSVASSIALKR